MAETICAVALDAATYAIDKLYSYRVPDELREQVQIGTRVLVPFGFGNKRAEGVVLAFREDTGEYRLKPIVEALDEQPVLTQEQLADVTGIHQTNISKLESGTANPSLRTLKRLAAGMGMKLKLEFVPAQPDSSVR